MREFQSIFATEIISYINRIRESGRTTACHEVHLGSLDRYLSIIGLPEKEINETTAVGWLKYRNAKPNYQANILSYYRGFANYLKAHGINAFVPDSPYTEHMSVVERGVKAPKLDKLVTIANVLKVGTDELLQDNLDAATLLHATEISERLKALSPEGQRKVMNVLDTLINELR